MIKPWLVATESLDTEQLPSTMLAEDPTQSVAAHVLAQQAENVESDLLIRDMGQMSDDLDQLEMIERHIADTHNVSDASTRVVDIALESFCKRWNIPAIKPGIEARTHAADFLRKQVALEGIGSAIASGFAKFIAWLKELFIKLKNKFNIFGVVAKTVQDRAARVRSYVVTGKYATKPTAFVTSEKLRGLELDGVINPKGVLGFVHKLANDTKSDLDALASQFSNWKENVRGNTEIKIGVTSKQGANVRALPGGVYFHLSVVDDTVSKEGTTKIEVTRDLSDKPIKLPMLSKEDMYAIIDHIDFLCDTIPRALKEMEPAIKAAEDIHETGDDSDEDKVILRHMHSAAACMATYVDQLTKVSTNTARALLEYAEESVKLSKA